MLFREKVKNLPNSEDFPSHQSGKSVWPHQHCPEFKMRQTKFHALPECYYCKFADFHLTEPVALEVGICCYPEIKNY